MSKISELSDGGVIQGGDTLIAVRSGGNVKVTYGGTTTANIDGGTIDNTTIGGTTPAAGNFTTGSFTGNVTFGDNDKAIFGAGSDLQIYHNGATGLLQNNTGSLFLTNYADDYDVVIQSDDSLGGVADYFRADGSSGSAILYNYGSAKLSTTATGVDVTGTVTADGLTVDGASNVRAGDSSVPSVESSAGDLVLKAGADDVILQTGGSGGEAIQFIDSTGTVYLNANMETGDISFYEDTGTTAKMFWDASAESLGIGTSSPSSVLHLSTSNDPKITLTDTGFGASADITGSNGNLRLNSQTATIFDMADSEVARIDSNGNVGIGTSSPARPLDVNGAIRVANANAVEWGGANEAIVGDTGGALIYKVGGAEIMRNTSTGLGIGTSSPSSFNQVGADTLVVGSGSGEQGITIYSGTANNGVLAFADGTTTTQQYQGYIGYNHASNFMRFFTGATERMRIDSSGNLLVGKTVTAINTAGVEVKNNGQVWATNDGGPSLSLNRKTSDGPVAVFYKDGTTVGSIGNVGGTSYVAGLTKGVRFGSLGLVPTNNTGNNSDASFDLGDAAVRWKDLYLSGGAYLGGTAAANKLDDYEEGTFTVTNNGDATGVISNQSGTYTKVGNVVHFDCAFTVTTNFTNSTIGGLPFTASVTNTASSIRPVSVAVDNAQDVAARISNGTTLITFAETSNGTPHEPDTVGATYRISGTYFTTA